MRCLTYPYCRPIILITCAILFIQHTIAFTPAFGEEPVQITIEGLSGDELTNVKKILLLPPGLIKDGNVDMRWLERFEKEIPKKVVEAIEPFGYYAAQTQVTLKSIGENLYQVLISINPGEPVRIERLNVKLEGWGAGEEIIKTAIAYFPLHEGDVLRQDIYEKAKEGMLIRAKGLGYLDAHFSTHEIRVSATKMSAEVDLVFQTGMQYRFGVTEFSGAPRYPQSFLNRFIEFKRGDIFSYAKIGETQQNLLNADRFKEVIIRTDKEAASDYHVPVKIELVPSPENRVRLGGGYGTDTGPRLSLQYKDMNVLRTTHKLEALLNVSQIFQGLALQYTLPAGKDTRSFTALNLNTKREIGDTYETRSISTEIEQARSFGKGMVGSLFCELLKENSDAGGERTNTFSVIPGARFSGRQYDSLIRPRKGYRYSLELKGTDQSLGSDTGFIRFFSFGDMFLPISDHFTLITKTKAGATVQNEPARDLPIALRFFAGGDNDVRGYSYKSLGPKGNQGDVIGGKNMFMGSIEIERSVGRDWGLAAFYDTGNAFNNFSDFNLAQSTGIGVRYYTKIGPIKLDVARQIGVRDPEIRLHIALGFGL